MGMPREQLMSIISNLPKKNREHVIDQLNPKRKVRKNKLNAKKITVDGMTFDSKKEYARWHNYMLRAKTGEFTKVDRQVPFKFIDTSTGKKLFTYYADIVIYNNDGTRKVVDVKGYRGGITYQYFKLKKKLIESQHKIEIIEE